MPYPEAPAAPDIRGGVGEVHALITTLSPRPAILGATLTNPLLCVFVVCPKTAGMVVISVAIVSIRIKAIVAKIFVWFLFFGFIMFSPYFLCPPFFKEVV
jgi:hypothetical protein